MKTPLPWITNEKDKVASAGDFRNVAYCVHALNATDDAAYIAQSANAYPKLIEALRDLEFYVRLGSLGEQEASAMRAAELLRELGEAS